MQYLNTVQIASILKKAYEVSARDHLMVLLAYQHGLRVSELAALKLTDLQDNAIHVQRSKGSLETTQPLVRHKNVLFDEPSALHRWLFLRESKEDILFPSREGGALDVRQIRRIIVQHMRMAKVPAELAHPHSLKHALASLLIRSKVDLAFVKQALGHKSISSTIHYVHIQDDEAQAAVQQAVSASLAQLAGR